jgi:polysaccharide deacetylase family protein (PEP-CTERM system associated)
VPKHILLTFDIEEWFQVENLKAVIRRSDWELIDTSVEKNSSRILEQLKYFEIPATFFVLGWVAERHPDLIRKISDLGHEVACHGYDHDLATSLDDGELFGDIRKAKGILENITGKGVYGYRAPSFSVSDKLLHHLKRLNFLYDSSYNSFGLNNRYGKLDGSLNEIAKDCFLAENGIYEIALSNVSLFSLNVPLAGGAFFRLFPFFVFKQLVRKKIARDGIYNFYLHPWEFEPEQPRMKNIKFNYQFRHYYGLKNTGTKFNKLVEFLKYQGCEFSTIKNYVDKIVKKTGA